MQTFLDQYGSLITWLGIVSSFTFFMSLLIIPWIICRLEKDFFIQQRVHKKKENEHPLIFILLKILRYAIGTLLVLAGILMIFLPGQGLLTIILGVQARDFLPLSLESACWIFLVKEHLLTNCSAIHQYKRH